MLKCPNCGGELKYDTQLKKVKCKYCASAFDVEELIDRMQVAEEEQGNPNYSSSAVKSKQEELDEKNSFEGKSYKCTQCGATLLTFDDTAVTFCSYCGSQAMLEDKMVRQNNPDMIIPFAKSKEDCIKAYRQKVDKFLFAPKYMKSDFTVEKFRGIYMPYGIYHLKKKGDLIATGEKYAYRRGDYVYYNQYIVTAHDTDISYEGISFDLVSKFYDNFSTSIPFDYREAIAFNPAYLAGYYADSLNVKKSVYERAASMIAEPDAQRRLKQRREFAKWGCSTPKARFQSDCKVGMFPVYFLAIRNQQNDAIHYAVVNGQTGKVAIELPIDFKKYVGLSLLIALIIFVLMNTSFTIKPIGVLVFCFVSSLISLLLSSSQLKRIDIKRTHRDDIGFVSAEKNISTKDVDVKKPSRIGTVLVSALKGFLCALFLGAFLAGLMADSPGFKNVAPTVILIWIFSTILFANSKFKNHKIDRRRYVKLLGEEVVRKKEEQYVEHAKTKFKFLRKEIIALVISIFVLISGTIRDEVYYTATIVALVLNVMCFYDLVKEHNILVSNKIPQLEKRGGDENE